MNRQGGETCGEMESTCGEPHKGWLSAGDEKSSCAGHIQLDAERNRNANGSSVQSLTLENDNVCLWLF